MNLGLLQEQIPGTVAAQQLKSDGKHLADSVTRIHQTSEGPLPRGCELTDLDFERVDIGIAEWPYPDLMEEPRMLAELFET